MSKNFYDVLSVQRNASSREIKDRFRTLARERHPDRFQGSEKEAAEKTFQEITEAFNVLTDPTRRRQHDRALDRPQTTSTTSHGPEQQVRAFLNRGIRAYQEGSYLDAANNFYQATQADGKNAQAWYYLALTCTHEERWLGKGREAIERACELEPKKTTNLKLAGKIFAQSGMTARAKQYYNQALRLGGPDAAVRKALAALGSVADSSAEAASTKTAKPEKERISGLFKKIW